MSYKKIAFVDRDGTLIREPEDFQVDRLDKVRLVPFVIPALLDLKKAGYRFVMVTNQDGLGTESFPEKDFQIVHDAVLDLFASQGIEFDEVLICPHTATAGCLCRKPHLGLVRKYLTGDGLDLRRSFVVGDRKSDMDLAKNMGLAGYLLADEQTATADHSDALSWPEIVRQVLSQPRCGRWTRATNETSMEVFVDLDRPGRIQISTGIGFFDHMLEQLAKHGAFSLELAATGDLHVDEHHTVEDAALALGAALKQALGDKTGIGRYGFVLPMDEARASVSVDVSGRPHLEFEAEFPRDQVGGLSTEMVEHFFQSLSQALGMTLHVEIRGRNTHHMVECAFKGVAKCLKQAFALTGEAGVPSTKGAL